jgi:hypothetical protein
MFSGLARFFETIKTYATLENATLAWIGVKTWFRANVLGVQPRGAHAYRLYAFNQTEPVDGLFHAVFSPGRHDVSDVRDAIDWDEYRIDVRYTYRGNKYRVLYRQDDDVPFPLPRSMGIVVAPKLASACLVRKDDGREIDVTERVRKYMGPDRDFYKKHGLYVRVQDMFPFDDHEDNADRFQCVRLYMSTGKRLEFDYGSNDAMNV